MKNKKFLNRIEKLNKTFHELFCLFLFIFILTVLEIVIYKVSGFDLENTFLSISEGIFSLVLAIFMFFSRKMIQKKKKSIGIIGIILGCFLVIFSGFIFKILGAYLIINSAFYLEECNNH